MVDKLVEWLLGFFITEKQIASILRGLMKIVGGYLIAQGATQAQVNSLTEMILATLPGILVAAFGQLLSAVSKVKNK